MHIKLLKHVLVGDTDVMPTARGTVVEVSDAQGKEFVAEGLADEVKTPEVKQAPAAENKMAAAPANKTAPKEVKAK
jgi:translation initiation factor IF-2